MSVNIVTTSSISFLQAMANRLADGLAPMTMSGDKSSTVQDSEASRTDTTTTDQKNVEDQQRNSFQTNAKGSVGVQTRGSANIGGNGASSSTSFKASFGLTNTADVSSLVNQLSSKNELESRRKSKSKSRTYRSSYSTEISSIIRNSRDVQSSYSASSNKRTQSVTSTVKRSYYKATFSPINIDGESFTNMFFVRFFTRERGAA